MSGDQNYLIELLENPETIKRIVSNVFWGRSGSFLLCSLFDNHPEILMLPFGDWSGHYRRFHNYANNLTPETIDEIIAKICEDHPFLIKEWNATNPSSMLNTEYSMVRMLGESKSEAFGTDREKLNQYLKISFRALINKNIVNAANILKALNVAYAASLGRTITTKNPLIFFNAHTPLLITLNELSNDFSDCKCIVSVRFPADTYDSHLRHHAYEAIAPPFASLPRRLLEMMMDTQHMNISNTNVFAVKLEDLHLNNLSIIKELTRTLGISWHESLLSSTVDGLTWYHTKNGQLLTGANPKFKYNHTNHQVISKLDALKLSIVFDRPLCKWGYVDNAKVKQKFLQALILLSPSLLPFKLGIMDFSSKLSIKQNVSILFNIIKETIRLSLRMCHYNTKKKERLSLISHLKYQPNDGR